VSRDAGSEGSLEDYTAILQVAPAGTVDNLDVVLSRRFEAKTAYGGLK
jgi:hypothetical protein